MSSTTLDKACGIKPSLRRRSQSGYKYTIIQPIASPQPAMMACLVEEKVGRPCPAKARCEAASKLAGRLSRWLGPGQLQARLVQARERGPARMLSPGLGIPRSSDVLWQRRGPPGGLAGWQRWGKFFPCAQSVQEGSGCVAKLAYLGDGIEPRV
eukprot:4925-Amphidinium_carterae.2